MDGSTFENILQTPKFNAPLTWNSMLAIQILEDDKLVLLIFV